MDDNIGLCCGSLVQTDFKGLVAAAAAAGFSNISLWPTLYEAALGDGMSERDMQTMLNDHGLAVGELDPCSSWLPVELAPDDLAVAFHRYTEDDFYRMADAFGARSLNLIQQGPDDTPLSQRSELIGSLCERATAHGLLVSFEFMPWSPVANLAQAMELVAMVGHDDFGVNIDIWHHFRSGGSIAELAEVDPAWVTAVQFNDVASEPWPDPLQETSQGRLMPGMGSSDSTAVLSALRSAGVTSPLSVEVFSAELMAMPPTEVAVELMTRMTEVLDRTRREPCEPS
ncbi:MAG: sugar phosphate isomerase/epimerase [Acidimicrobiales bacterium]